MHKKEKVMPPFCQSAHLPTCPGIQVKQSTYLQSNNNIDASSSKKSSMHNLKILHQEKMHLTEEQEGYCSL